MGILIWFLIFIVGVISTITIRLYISVKKYENKKITRTVDIGTYALIISLIIASVVVAVILKTTLSYMYICAACILLVINIAMSAFLYFLRHKEI